MTSCSRCGRNVTRPVFAGGMAFGSVCYRKVASKPKRRHAARVDAVQRVIDPNQRDLFAEAS